MAENPILPNTNVGSKLKEILAEKVPINSKKERKSKGKWDDIMTQIAEGQKRSSENKNLKEVKSKIFADFKPPKLIRPQQTNSSASGGAAGPLSHIGSENRNRKISESRKSIASSTRSNSTLSSKSNNLDPNTASHGKAIYL